MLFKGFVQTFYKMKIQGSGWPADVETENQKLEYLSRIQEEDGIELHQDEIVKSDGKRNIAKSLLVRVFGKMGQKVERQTEIVRGYDQLKRFTSDLGKYIIHSVEPLNGETAMVTYSTTSDSEVHFAGSFLKNQKDDDDNVMDYIQDVRNGPVFVNVVIASWVTAEGRILLYNELTKVNPYGLVMCDTDSAIFSASDGDYIIPDGVRLGDFTDEIKKDFGKKSKLMSATSLGPKQYGMRIQKEDQSSVDIVKLRGFGWNSESEELLTLNRLEDMLYKKLFWKKYEKSDVSQTVTYENHLSRNAKRQIISGTLTKCYSPVSDKRLSILKNYVTLPYGYSFSCAKCVNRVTH